MSEPFKFKQFTVQQDRCAMKIGTDGVLLGAWTTIPKNCQSILDIGAGTGIIGLMMAQRSPAELIDAIELDDNAFEQCTDNFEASPWSDRLFCYHADFEEFVGEIDDTYDLIVSNPPFYMEDVSSGDSSRDNARQNGSLPFSILFKGVKKLLSEQGFFAMIAPYGQEESILDLGRENGMHPTRITHVRGNEKSEIKRSLIQFSQQQEPLKSSSLTIEKERHRYTKDYIDLTKEFYLKM